MHTDGGSVFQKKKKNFKRSKDTAAQIDKISLWSLRIAKFLGCCSHSIQPSTPSFYQVILVILVARDKHN